PRVATLWLLMLACFCGGLAVAKLRAEAAWAPIAPSGMAPTLVEAWVLDVDSAGRNGARIVVAAHPWSGARSDARAPAHYGQGAPAAARRARAGLRHPEPAAAARQPRRLRLWPQRLFPGAGRDPVRLGRNAAGATGAAAVAGADDHSRQCGALCPGR